MAQSFTTTSAIFALLISPNSVQVFFTSRSRIWLRRGGRTFLGKFTNGLQWSHASKVSKFMPGSGACFRESGNSYILKYQIHISPLFWYLFFKNFTLHLCGYFSTFPYFYIKKILGNFIIVILIQRFEIFFRISLM